MSGKVTGFYGSPENEQNWLCLHVFLFLNLLLLHSGLVCKLVVEEGRSREDISYCFFINMVLFIWKFTEDRKCFHTDFMDGETEAQTSYYELTSYLAHKWPSNATPLPEYQSSVPFDIFSRCRRISEEKMSPAQRKPQSIAHRQGI